MKKYFLLFLFLGNLSWANDLPSYRADNPELPGIQKVIDEQLNRIFSVLGLQQGSISLNERLLTGNIPGFSHRIHSGNFIRKNFYQGIEQVFNEKNFGRPPSYDPSVLSVAEAQDRIRRWEFDIIRKHHPVEKLPEIVNSYEKYMQVNALFLAAEKPAGEKQVVADVNESLKKLPSGEKIIQILGECQSVEIEDGRLAKLIFADVHISLPVLVGVRIGKDTAFLRAQEYLLTFVTDSKNQADQDKDEAGLKRFSAIEESLGKKFSDAQKIHSTLEKLGDIPLNELIAFFILSRGNDIPVSGDIEHFSAKIAKLGATRNDSKNSQLGIDYSYYSDLFSQLAQLESYLNYENDRRTKAQDTLKKIKEGRK